MFRWGIIFSGHCINSAAALGFGGLAGTAAGAAKIVSCRRDYPVPGEACLLDADVLRRPAMRAILKPKHFLLTRHLAQSQS